MFPAFWTYAAQGLMIAGFNSRVGPLRRQHAATLLEGHGTEAGLGALGC
jgi:hypothetical protein